MAKANSTPEEAAVNEIFLAIRRLTAVLNRFDERNSKADGEVLYTANSGGAIGASLAALAVSVQFAQWRATTQDKAALNAARTDPTFQRFMQSQCLETGTPENGGAA